MSSDNFYEGYYTFGGNIEKGDIQFILESLADNDFINSDTGKAVTEEDILKAAENGLTLKTEKHDALNGRSDEFEEYVIEEYGIDCDIYTPPFYENEMCRVSYRRGHIVDEQYFNGNDEPVITFAMLESIFKEIEDDSLSTFKKKLEALKGSIPVLSPLKII